MKLLCLYFASDSFAGFYNWFSGANLELSSTLGEAN